ncbi:MAG: peptidylprolyl isomerase [Desulfatiglandaceae bacterium]
MKRKAGMAAWITAFALALTLMGWQVSAEEKADSEDTVAKVNGKPITQAQLDRSLNFARQKAEETGQPLGDAQRSQLKKQTLEKLIGSELLYQASVKEGIKIDEKSVKTKFEEWKKRFPDDAQYEQMLTALNVTEAEVKNEIRKGIAIQELIDQKFMEDIAVPEKEIKAYYDSHPEFFEQPQQVKARHILVKLEPEATEAEKEGALKKINEIQKKQEAGEDFAQLAKEYSEDPSADKGGDLGYFGRQQMVKPFSDAAFDLESGQVSDVVKTRFGYHLIKVEDKKAASTAPYESVKEKIGQYLKQTKLQEEITQYVDKLKKKGTVEVFLKDGS